MQQGPPLPTRLPRLRIDHLYALLAVSAMTIAVSLLSVPPNDLWWHVRIGQIIAEEGRIPGTNMFAWSIPADAPFVYAAWLGELLLYTLHATGGFELVVFARNMLALATFTLVGLEAARLSGSWKLAGLAATLTGLMAINNVVIRPQVWGWVPFGLSLLILRRYCDRAVGPAWLAALPALMAFWVNVHGSFVLGIVLVGGVAAGETLRRFLREPDALESRELTLLYAAGAATALATIANPRGLGILAYVHKLMTDPPSQRLISEWQPPAPTDLPNGTFFASVLLLLVALAFVWARPRPTDIILVGGFLWLGWNGIRYVFWYGLLATPLLAQWLSRGLLHAPSRAYPRQSGVANGVIAAFLIVPVVAVQPWFVRSIPMPAGYYQGMLPPPAPPLLDTETPVSAADYLRAHPGGSLFNEMAFGSYLTWALPGQPVFIDPRVELYPLKQWEDYVEITQGRRSVELLDQYGADRALLSLKHQPKLSQVLSESGVWQKEYSDPWSEIWRRP